jgi:hypothetical protein
VRIAKCWPILTIAIMVGFSSESIAYQQVRTAGTENSDCTLRYTKRECNPEILRNSAPSPETEPRIPLDAGILEQAIDMCEEQGGVRITATASWYTSSPCFNSVEGPPVPAHTSNDVLRIDGGSETKMTGDDCLQSGHPSIAASFQCNECGVSEESIVGGSATFTLTCCNGCPSYRREYSQ